MPQKGTKKGVNAPLSALSVMETALIEADKQLKIEPNLPSPQFGEWESQSGERTIMPYFLLDDLRRHKREDLYSGLDEVIEDMKSEGKCKKGVSLNSKWSLKTDTCLIQEERKDLMQAMRDICMKHRKIVQSHTTNSLDTAQTVTAMLANGVMMKESTLIQSLTEATTTCLKFKRLLKLEEHILNIMEKNGDLSKIEASKHREEISGFWSDAKVNDPVEQIRNSSKIQQAFGTEQGVQQLDRKLTICSNNYGTSLHYSSSRIIHPSDAHAVNSDIKFDSANSSNTAFAKINSQAQDRVNALIKLPLPRLTVWESADGNATTLLPSFELNATKRYSKIDLCDGLTEVISQLHQAGIKLHPNPEGVKWLSKENGRGNHSDTGSLIISLDKICGKINKDSNERSVKLRDQLELVSAAKLKHSEISNIDALSLEYKKAVMESTRTRWLAEMIAVENLQNSLKNCRSSKVKTPKQGKPSQEGDRATLILAVDLLPGTHSNLNIENKTEAMASRSSTTIYNQEDETSHTKTQVVTASDEIILHSGKAGGSPTLKLEADIQQELSDVFTMPDVNTVIPGCSSSVQKTGSGSSAEQDNLNLPQQLTNLLPRDEYTMGLPSNVQHVEHEVMGEESDTGSTKTYGGFTLERINRLLSSDPELSDNQYAIELQKGFDILRGKRSA